MPINENKLAALLATLLTDSTPNQEEPKQEEPKQEEKKPQGQIVEPEDAGQAEEPAAEDEKAKRLRELEEQQVVNQNKLIDSRLEAGYANMGLDKDTVQGLSQFLLYDKLKNDKGEADEEQIKVFLELLSSAALRKPPKHKDVLEELQSNADGFGKYLPKK